MAEPSKQGSSCFQSLSQSSTSYSLAGRMKRKHQEEQQRKRRRGEKSRTGRVRQKGKQQGAGKNTTQERDAALVPVMEKVFFTCNIEQKMKMHEVGEDTRVLRGQNSD